MVSYVPRNLLGSSWQEQFCLAVLLTLPPESMQGTNKESKEEITKGHSCQRPFSYCPEIALASI